MHSAEVNVHADKALAQLSSQKEKISGSENWGDVWVEASSRTLVALPTFMEIGARWTLRVSRHGAGRQLPAEHRGEGSELVPPLWKTLKGPRDPGLPCLWRSVQRI